MSFLATRAEVAPKGAFLAQLTRFGPKTHLRRPALDLNHFPEGSLEVNPLKILRSHPLFADFSSDDGVWRFVS